MPGADLFRQMGFFISESFLDPSLCDEMVRDAAREGYKDAAIWKGGRGYVVDPKVRRAQQINISPSAAEQLRDHLNQLKPRLEEHFGLSLENFETPLCLGYQVGDFYQPHRDNVDLGEGAPGSISRRKISIVLFLNGGREPFPSGYRGGELTFYGLLKNNRSADRGIPLGATRGLLVAFPSERVHQVQPVTEGHRYTVVSWFY